MKNEEWKTLNGIQKMENKKRKIKKKKLKKKN